MSDGSVSDGKHKNGSSLDMHHFDIVIGTTAIQKLLWYVLSTIMHYGH